MNKNSAHMTNKDACSNLCTNLTAEAQKNIISQCDVIDLNARNNTDFYMYAIASEWWIQWCDFVNVSFNYHLPGMAKGRL